MHLLLHVIGAQADSDYMAYFPIGMFFVVLAFHVFFFLQRVVGPLLTPSSAVATAGGAPGGSCCASAVPMPANLNKVRHIFTNLQALHVLGHLYAVIASFFCGQLCMWASIKAGAGVGESHQRR